MHKDYGLAPVQIFEDGSEGRIAKPLGPGIVRVTGEDADAVPLEHVEGIFNFAQAALGVRQRNDGKQSKPPRMLERKIGRIVVASPRRATRALGVAEPYARQRQRKDGGRDALGVHCIERLLRRPVERCGRDPRSILRDIGRRREVMMHIDQP